MADTGGVWGVGGADRGCLSEDMCAWAQRDDCRPAIARAMACAMARAMAWGWGRTPGDRGTGGGGGIVERGMGCRRTWPWGCARTPHVSCFAMQHMDWPCVMDALNRRGREGEGGI